MAITQPSPFLRLPLPLRRRIYEYALVSHQPIEIHPTARRNSVTSRKPSINGQPPSRVSALLQTNSQIQHEASDIFYSQNTFIIPWGFPNLGCRWLDSLSTPNRRALRDVRFCYGDGAFWTIYDAKIALSALEMGLKKSGALADLQDLKLWVPVCEFSVHTWKELEDREDAMWVGVEETRPFVQAKGRKNRWRV